MGMEIRPLNEDQMRAFIQNQLEGGSAPDGQWVGARAESLGLYGVAKPKDLERIYGVELSGPSSADLPRASEPVHLISIGNIHVTDQAVLTPAGSLPLAQVNVTTTDQTSTTTHTPAWAVVMVVLFIWFFLLSLLFLLAKETRVSGFVAVHIQAGGYSYTEQVPVRSAAERAEVLRRAQYLQSVIGRARNAS